MPKQYKQYLVLALVVLALLLIFAYNFAKDKILSDQLSASLKIPVEVKGLSLNLVKLFQAGYKLKLAYLGLGEGDSKVNLKKIVLQDIKKNPESPSYCLDAQASFDGFYLGTKMQDNCTGKLELRCVPYKFKQGESYKGFKIKIPTAVFNLKGSEIITNATINSQQEGVAKLNIDGEVKRSKLANLLACLNSQTDEVQSEIKVPKFNLSFTSNEKLDPLETLWGQGNFELYQGQFRLIDLLKPLVAKFGSKEQNTKNEGKKFDSLTASFLIRDKQVDINNILLNSNYISANGHGVIDFEQNLDFKIRIKNSNRTLPTKTLMLDNFLPKGLIPLRITGTVEKPKVRPHALGVIEAIQPPVLDHTKKAVKNLLGSFNLTK